MRFTDENHDHDWLAHGVGETAGCLLDAALDDWGFFFIVIAGVVVVVFLAVSALGFLFSGESLQNLRLK